MESRGIILFDGVCNLCNGAVNFVIKRDKKSVFKFAAIQSEEAKNLMMEGDFQSEDLKTFILLLNERFYTKSTAALKVCRYLSGLWPMLYWFMIIPKFIRDFIYNIISRNRYKWFGRKESCTIPTPELQSKFLNDIV
ncbi:MAG: thiol-disulfide oxidoreductase DCC family protein [Ginsengibacter sp.]|jgi:predicted DCC family thiol-disulfide oxidoreductase YuxK